MIDHQVLRSKLFFLDTQTYMARNFQFQSGVLRTLQNHLEDDGCHLLITDVNVREVRRHLRRKAEEAYTLIKRVQKDAMILRNTPDLSWHGIFEPVTADQIFAELTKNFDEFLDHSMVEVVPTNTVNIDAVFDAYFEERPPFATSGKKSEFPDAFVLHAVEAISRKRGYALYVVSEDRDVKSFCGLRSNLISLGRLEELLELVLKNSERLAVPARFAEEMYGRFEEDIQKQIREKLSSAEFVLDDEEIYFEAEVNGFDIEVIEHLGRNLTDVSKDGASFELITRVAVIADLTFPDYDRSPWDPEDKAYPFLLHNKLVRRYTHSASVVVDISFDDGIAANAELVGVNVEELTDLSSAKVEQISFREMDINEGYEDEGDS